MTRGIAKLVKGAGHSFKKAANATGLSKTTLYDWWTGKRLPQEENFEKLLKVGIAEPEERTRWLEALRRVKGAHPDECSSEDPGADVSVRLNKWVDSYDPSPRAEQLLRAIPIAPKEEDQKAPGKENENKVRALVEFASVIGHLASHMTVEVVTCHREIAVTVDSPERFWALVSADSVLRDFAGSRKWLIDETEKIIKGRNDEQSNHLRLIWRTLYELLLRADPLEQCAWPPRQVIEDLDDKAKTFLRLRALMDWLLHVFPAEDDVGSGLRQAWERYLTEKYPGRSSDGSRRFAPALISIDAKELCGYSFQAMRCPLTIGDMASLWETRAAPNSTVPKHPYVLGSLGDERGDALPGFLRDLIERCLSAPGFDPREGWTWAVPTAPEWLALSGCGGEDRPYPWGTKPPTPQRANLRYPNEDGPWTVQSVGLLHLGRSPDGVQDCCGNVHEVVEWRPGGLDRKVSTLSSLRLAGGSFRSRPENASCRTFRRFTAVGAPRLNVGLRLIKYRTEDTELRTDALSRFLQQRTSPQPSRPESSAVPA
jgi:hypothetical protein